MSARASVWSPISLTVMRRCWSSGVAEMEYGWACHHSPRLRKRHCMNCPPPIGSRLSLRPFMVIDHMFSPAGRTSTTRSRCRNDRHNGSITRKRTMAVRVPPHSPIHHSRANGCPTNDAPVLIWWKKARNSPRYMYRWMDHQVSWASRRRSRW